MDRSIIRRQPAPAPNLPDSLHPILRRVYAARAVTEERELDYSLQAMLPFHALGGIADAAALLADALARNRRILIVADYDVDGATGCALAIRGLRQMGAGEIDYIVPSRFEFGYGLTPELVEVATERAPDLIVTVDNGISSLDGVRLAREKGMDVLITDHHLPGAQLPAANVIVNPNLSGDPFPSKNLAGVGVMFYVLIALRTRLRELDWFNGSGLSEPNLADLLDLVALGTVADVVALDRNNRILVSQGLARIRAGRCVPGIRALLRQANRPLATLSATDLGFVVGPRLNAAGRLSDMSRGIECLLSDDEDQVMEMALTLDGLNRERRNIQQEMHELASVELIEQQDNGGMPAGLCLYHESWHQGVVGIVASRIKEQWHRPVIAFARDSDGRLKGSARSISGVHIRDVLELISAGHPGLIIKFGGHAMAAGLTVAEQGFERFRHLFEQEVFRVLGTNDPVATILSDGELSEGDLGIPLAEEITRGGPWGQGFPEPMFDGVFELAERRIVGESHLKMRLRYPLVGSEFDAIAFNTVDSGWPQQVEQVRLAYRLDINDFQGRRRLQFIVEHVEPLAS